MGKGFARLESETYKLALRFILPAYGVFILRITIQLSRDRTQRYMDRTTVMGGGGRRSGQARGQASEDFLEGGRFVKARRLQRLQETGRTGGRGERGRLCHEAQHLEHKDIEV
jgi:hypothetical protein